MSVGFHLRLGGEAIDIAYIQSDYASTASSSPSLTANFPADPIPGNLLVCFAFQSSTLGTPTPPTGWATDLAPVVPTGGGGKVALFSTVAAPGTSRAVTVNTLNSEKAILIVEFSGPTILHAVGALGDILNGSSLPSLSALPDQMAVTACWGFVGSGGSNPRLSSPWINDRLIGGTESSFSISHYKTTSSGALPGTLIADAGRPSLVVSATYKP